MTRMLGAIVAALAAICTEPAVAALLICGIDQKYECGREGCAPGFAGRVHNRIDLDRGTYARCDDNGCETYPATFWRSGVFTTIEISGHAAIAKLSDTRSDPYMPGRLARLHLVEVVTLGIIVLVSYGTCSELDP